ncbi:MAG: 3-isopropylmalate dehydratase large subunit [Candidatus Marinimicrobia bacterium]|nr:3-isopropylmalate dehydratase large subunit [Candidatus Neomarinimicrobiota bacterium]
MGLTHTEKLLAAHTVSGEALAGNLIQARVDLVMCHEVTTPPAIQMLADHGLHGVFDPDRIVVTPDHFVPSKDIESAELARDLRKWVQENGIKHYYELGRHGICHALLPEQGHIIPGQTVVGGDSHSCTYGAFGVFSTGVGSTDLAAVLYTGELWFKVPESIKVTIVGQLPDGVYSKDIVLELISRLGVDGARYQALEYHGETLGQLSMEARMTITNMAIEAGAKSAVMTVDQVTHDYLKGRAKENDWVEYSADDDAQYVREITVDVSHLAPLVATPGQPSNGQTIASLKSDDLVPVDQVYIGSCTNGRIEDLRVVASIMKGRRIATGLRAIIVPATSTVWKQAHDEGLFNIFYEAGCVVSTATCGACLGGYMGVLASGEVCVSTTNRNFSGRMGHKDALVFLVSPATAAATAVSGKIADPRDYL